MKQTILVTFPRSGQLLVINTLQILLILSNKKNDILILSIIKEKLHD